MADLTGKTLANRYALQSKLGKGGQGTVYRAINITNNKVVAVKVLVASLDDADSSRDLFTREIQVAEHLRHSNIVRVFDADYDEEHERYYVVMELLTGGSLAERLKESGTMDPNAVLEVVRQVGSALQYAHGEGVVHRDIKPANIMFRSDGQAVLTDFGIAKIVGSTRTTVSTYTVGTPAYISPEQWDNKPANSLSDIYALGVVMYEMLTGKVPHESVEGDLQIVKAKHQAGLLVAPRKLNPNIPEPLEAVVLIALRKDPAQRFQDAYKLVEATEAAVRRGERPQRRRYDPTAPTILWKWIGGVVGPPLPPQDTIYIAREPHKRLPLRGIVTTAGIVGGLGLICFMLTTLPSLGGDAGDGLTPTVLTTPMATMTEAVPKPSVTTTQLTSTPALSATLTPIPTPPVRATDIPTASDNTPIPSINTPVPPTMVEPTPTKLPPTPIPATAVPVTQVPSTQVPPTQALPPQVLPTLVTPTPTDVPQIPTQVPKDRFEQISCAIKPVGDLENLPRLTIEEVADQYMGFWFHPLANEGTGEQWNWSTTLCLQDTKGGQFGSRNQEPGVFVFRPTDVESEFRFAVLVRKDYKPDGWQPHLIGFNVNTTGDSTIEVYDILGNLLGSQRTSTTGGDLWVIPAQMDVVSVRVPVSGLQGTQEATVSFGPTDRWGFGINALNLSGEDPVNPTP